MADVLTEVVDNDDVDNYELTPYGYLLLKLESADLARRVCDVLELRLRKFKLCLAVSGERLQFEPGLDGEDFAIINRAIMWHDLTDSKLHAKATEDLHAAVEAARHRTWVRRREERDQPST